MNVGQWIDMTVGLPSFVDRITEGCKESIFEDPILFILKNWRIHYGIFVRICCDYEKRKALLSERKLSEIENTKWISFTDNFLKNNNCLTIDAKNALDVNGVLLQCSEFLEKKPSTKRIPIVLNGEIGAEHFKCVENIWKAFSSLKMPVLVDKIAVGADRAYIKARNIPYLFEYDFVAREPKIIRWLPRDILKIIGMIYFDNKIWMISEDENEIFSFSLADGDLRRFSAFTTEYQDFFDRLSDVRIDCKHIKEEYTFEYGDATYEFFYNRDEVLEIRKSGEEIRSEMFIFLDKIDRSVLTYRAPYIEREWVQLKWFINKVKCNQIEQQ